jgi:hypothetical protein
MTFTYFDLHGVRRRFHLRFDLKQIAPRVLVCTLLAPAMCWPLCIQTSRNIL